MKSPHCEMRAFSFAKDLAANFRDSTAIVDAIQVASVLSVNADALVTHDWDFAKMRGLRVIG
jgi:predicted nucleic acid-binding protein